MVKEQLITNEKTGEELSLSLTIIASSIVVHHGGVIADCVIEIKRKQIVIVSKAAKKNAK